MTMVTDALGYKTVEYPVEKFAFALRLKMSRFVGNSSTLRDPEHVFDVVKRWAQREIDRKWTSAVFGSFEIRIDDRRFWTEKFWPENYRVLAVWAQAVRNVPDGHRSAVASIIFQPAQKIRIPVLDTLPWVLA